MKCKTYFMSVLLLLAGVFFSCENKDSEEPELDNHMMVNESKIPLQGMMFSYDKTSIAVADGKARGSYPMDLYLYSHKPYFEDVSEENPIIEDSAAMIHFKLYCKENGILNTGDYSWDVTETNAGTCINASQCTKELPMQIWFELNDGRSAALIPQFELVSLSVSLLRVNKLEDGFYEISFEGIDNNGAEISGYFKGDFPLYHIIKENETNLDSGNLN